ncbi:MAG TPA: MFS transporter [Blastocatellia bacterium]|nr:MFS transporter [Blastocatellia bacterium]
MKAPVERVRRLPLWQPLAVRDFRLLWLGQSISLFGDQFYLVALYWLVQHVSGSGVALGTVLMVAGASQALFQLIGGAVGDRFPPRTLMLGSDILRTAITLLITLIVYLNVTQLWHLYVLSAIFGSVEAFFYPAYMSAIPMLIMNDHLPAGNALLRGTRRLMASIGPPIAGVVITSVSLTAAFGIDAITFVLSAITLWLMRQRRREETAEDAQAGAIRSATPEGLIKSIGDGLRYAFNHKIVWPLLIYVSVIEFSFVGPSTVGLAVMARQRFGGDEGASALGWMLGAFGAGMLIGMLLAGSLRIKQHRGRLIITLVFTIGLGLAMLSFATHVIWAAVVLALMGLGGGLANILILSWMQETADPRMLGRVMSLMMFAVAGLEPLSFLLAGIVADVSLIWVFIGGGTIMIITSLLSLGSAILNAD